MWAYPGSVSLRELSPEQRLGLWLNIPALEASDDLRDVLVLGSVLSHDDDGLEYIKELQEVSWWNDPDSQAEGARMLDITKAKRGKARVKQNG